MELREFSGRGREVMISYTCRRCGAVEYHPLKQMFEPESYGYLHNTKLPKGWREVDYFLLCPSCTQEFKNFVDAAK